MTCSGELGGFRVRLIAITSHAICFRGPVLVAGRTMAGDAFRNEDLIPRAEGYRGLEALRGFSGALTGRTVVLLGASGFLGRYLASLLSALGAEVVRATSSPPQHPRVFGIDRWVLADLADPESLRLVFESVKPDLIINATRRGFPRLEAEFQYMWEVNTRGVMNLLDTMSAYPETRLVHLGSSTEYGPSPSPVGAGSPRRPVGNFGRTKLAGSALVEGWARGFGRSVAIVRPFTIYGPGGPANGFLPTMLRAVKNGTVLPLSKGTRRDYVHVWDVASATVRAAFAASSEAPQLDVGTGFSYDPQAVVKLFEATVGQRVPIAAQAWPKGPMDVSDWCADTSAMREHLSWQPEISLKEGLQAWWLQIS